MDINENRLNFASTVTEIAGTVVAGRDDTLEKLKDQFEGDLPTVEALEYVAPAGRILFIGLFQGDFGFSDPYFHRKELTLMASRNALPSDFKQIISMMEERKISIDQWVTHRGNFDEIATKFPIWSKHESNVIKAVVSL